MHYDRMVDSSPRRAFLRKRRNILLLNTSANVAPRAGAHAALLHAADKCVLMVYWRNADCYCLDEIHPHHQSAFSAQSCYFVTSPTSRYAPPSLLSPYRLSPFCWQAIRDSDPVLLSVPADVMPSSGGMAGAFDITAIATSTGQISGSAAPAATSSRAASQFPAVRLHVLVAGKALHARQPCVPAKRDG